MNESQARLIERMKVWRQPVHGLPIFAKDCLKILDKSGALVPFEFNDAQWTFHEAIEKQKSEVGMVRASVLKGRRQGISTYVAARYYHRAVTLFGRKVYILSHEKKSAEALFGIVDRFQRHNPFAPKTGEDNASKLTFPGLESSYTVATAGAQEGGRGGDINLFHGSEAAFWQNAESHFAASVQCVALLPDTEIILESTSGGPSGKFFETFRKGQQGDDIYRSIFLPWFVQKEYSFLPRETFKLDPIAPDDTTPSEVDVAAAYNLSDGQMMWRRLKISELGLSRFNREYPSSVDDAWASIDNTTFINPAAVLRARGRKTEPSGALIMGVDPAGGGGDRFAIVFREGNKVTKCEWRNKIDSLEATNWLLEVITTHKPDRVNIDSGNIGQAIITNLRQMDPYCANVIRSVSFGSPSQSKQANKQRVGPENRRAEMWGRLKEWVEDKEGCASLPDIDDLASDLVSVKDIIRTNGDWLLMSKSDMRKAGLRSPDLGDALALTFASKEYFPDTARVKPSIHETAAKPVARAASTVYEGELSGSGGGWMV